MKNIFLIFFVLISCCLSAQDNQWTKYEIGEMGSILVPNTLILRDTSSVLGMLFNEMSSSRLEKMNIKISEDIYKLTFQPKEDIELNKSSFDKYSRIIVEYNFEKNGFLSYKYIPNKTELNDIFNYLRKNVLTTTDLFNHATSSNLKILKWYPIKSDKINNSAYVKISYLRQLNNSPQVKVDVYMFHNTDYYVTITLSYRINESDLWSSDFDTAIKTFKFKKLINK